jgi:hypothetical protein
VLAADPGPLLLSPFVLAELDHLLLERVGAEAERALLNEVARGDDDLVGFGAAEVAEASEVLGRYGDLRLGLADAWVVVDRRGGADDPGADPWTNDTSGRCARSGARRLPCSRRTSRNGVEREAAA